MPKGMPGNKPEGASAAPAKTFAPPATRVAPGAPAVVAPVAAPTPASVIANAPALAPALPPVAPENPAFALEATEGDKDWSTHPFGVLTGSKIAEQFKTKEEAGAWLDNLTQKQQNKSVVVQALKRATVWS